MIILIKVFRLPNAKLRRNERSVVIDWSDLLYVFLRRISDGRFDFSKWR